MGGSAGGLEAFGQFFTNMPIDSGMAFVLVSHLDPTQKGMMPELLQRFTRMQVFQVKDGMEVCPNCVYVIPPNRDMSILHGTLQLLETSSPRGLRLPIDFFFRHLAEDQEERAVGVILSGMGTDGTLGIKAIREKLGMVMVEDPASAKFDGMPRSAIDTGIVDYIGPVKELPAKLLDYAKHPSATLKQKPIAEEKQTNAIQKITVLLRDQTGHDFSFYKKNTLVRRIERRMCVHKITNIDVYIRYLRENPQEIELLFKELLIGVTNFFRDHEAFEALKENALLQILKDRARGNVLRIWVPGCSTGEEAYSIAIILLECMAKVKQRGVCKIQVFATDIDKDAIDKARQGVYASNIAADVSPERLQRFFIKEGNGYRLKKEIREMVIFAPQNVIMDPPFTKLDLVSCRNVLIYMTAELQKKLLPLLHYALNPGGLLFLGVSETIGSLTDLFSTVDNKWRIYRRKESASARMGMFELPVSPLFHGEDQPQHAPKARKSIETTISDTAQQVLSEHFTPPAVIINEKGDIVYISGRTGKYLEPAAGKTNINIFAMAREGLRSELEVAIRRAIAQKKTITMKDLMVKTNGNHQAMDLTVKPFSESEGMKGLLMVVFGDVGAPSKRAASGKAKTGSASRQGKMYKELEKELAFTRERLQTTVEEMETSREELKSSNEELQSTNEELQSTNEELTTSKEELQSMNEELVTVNTELQTKIDELAGANNDMQNLLNNVEIATIFLDDDLNVRRFTPQTTKILNLIPSDVGRPISHIVSNLKYEALLDDIKAVLQTLVFKDAQVQTKDGRWYLMRIMPYRTLDNIIGGVVATFTEITGVKRLEASLRESEVIQEACRFAESIVETIREPLLIMDAELRVVSANRSFYRTFHVSPEETKNSLLYELGNRQWDIPALRRLLEDILPKNNQINDYKIEHDFPEIGRRVMLLNAQQIIREGAGIQMILLAIEDITEHNKRR
ncbi:MAG: methyltransferase/methylesterase, CheR/CheB with sensor [Candidatus Brocadiaceae bacterium]|nr:methyltransferase/methylesterase, CheR/CheB with sensor [Candidatus Brocadiaceae bacterium]